MSGCMLFVAMALLVVGVECASQTQTTGSITDNSIPISDTYVFNKFDPIFGTLTAVDVTLTATPTVDLTANNLGTVNTVTLNTVAASTTLTATVSGQPSASVTSLTTSATATPAGINLPPNNAGGGYSTTITGSLQTNAAVYTDSTDLATYTGVAGTTVTITIAAGAGTVTGTSTPAGLSYGGDISSVTFSYTLTYVYTASVAGDPQFVGIQGQRFQIHGIPDEHFNLISTPTYTLNSQFVYIASGICNYNDTQCFSHPGTYIGQVGLLVANNRIKITSGSHANGLTTRINNKSAPVGTFVRFNNDTSVRVVSHSHVELRLLDITLSVVNSDLFLNLAVDFTNANMLQAGLVKVIVPASASPAKADQLVSSTYPEYQMHGMIGQTWRNIEWPQSRLYQGEPTDYLTTDLFATDFVYTQSKPSK